MKPKLPLAVRTYRCKRWTLVSDRNLNASANLAAGGEQQQGTRPNAGTQAGDRHPGARQLSLLSMPVEGATSRSPRRREPPLKQGPAGHASAWRKHWTVPDRDRYETRGRHQPSHLVTGGAGLSDSSVSRRQAKVVVAGLPADMKVVEVVDLGIVNAILVG